MIKMINLTGLILIMALSLFGCSLFGPTTPPDGGGSDLTEAGGSADEAEAKTSEAQGQLKLATALLMKGEYDKALAELQIAQEMDPKNVDVVNFLGLTYYGLQEYTQAIENYQKALELDPKRTDVRNNLGLVYLAQMDYNRALAEFNLCIKDLNYPKKHLPLNNIGLVYLEMGQPQQALAALTRATEVSPDYAKSYQLIGQVYLSQGMHQQAIEALKKAEKLAPNDPETQDSLIRARAGQNASNILTGSEQ